MSSVDSAFYAWLAVQPAFIEVAAGVAFVLVVAPAVLAVVAAVMTRLERIVAAIAAQGNATHIHAHPIHLALRTS